MTKKSKKQPNDYGRHEALHTASVIAEMVETHLINHPEIEKVPEWEDLAEKAHQALFDLYQAIGEVHLK